MTLHPLPSHRHFALSLQVTVQVPEHFTPHSADSVQVTVLPAARVPSQSALVAQVTTVFAPPLTSQRALSLQAMVLLAPTVPAQLEAVVQVTAARSVPLIAQVAVCAQLTAQPEAGHDWVHVPLLHAQALPWHEQPAPSHAGMVGLPHESARAPKVSAASSSSARARAVRMSAHFW